MFARLRALRKETADAEGVPAYALFTNDQLAEMVQRRVVTAAALREIAGRRRGAGRKIRRGLPQDRQGGGAAARGAQAGP